MLKWNIKNQNHSGHPGVSTQNLICWTSWPVPQSCRPGCRKRPRWFRAGQWASGPEHPGMWSLGWWASCWCSCSGSGASGLEHAESDCSDTHCWREHNSHLVFKICTQVWIHAVTVLFISYIGFGTLFQHVFFLWCNLILELYFNRIETRRAQRLNCWIFLAMFSALLCAVSYLRGSERRLRWVSESPLNAAPCCRVRSSTVCISSQSRPERTSASAQADISSRYLLHEWVIKTWKWSALLITVLLVHEKVIQSSFTKWFSSFCLISVHSVKSEMTLFVQRSCVHWLSPVPLGSCTPDIASRTEDFPELCTPRTTTCGKGNSFSNP